MNNKVFNVNIQELIYTLEELAKEYKYADFEIETSGMEAEETKLIVYPVSFKKEQKNLPPSKLDSNKGLDDLINDLT